MGLVPINKIIPFSMVDGPGSRTSIFLQGCNIACAYCHNPETQRVCKNCGICVDGCPGGALVVSNGKVIWDEEKCIDCDRCITVCPYYATPKVKMMDAQMVFAKVKKNIPFVQGITVSGGECTLYPEFLTELFLLAKKENLTCLIDSNGMVDLSLFPELVQVCDGVMLDIKSWDSQVYKKLTGANNDTVKKNLKYLAELDKLEELRIVCVPGEVDAELALKGIAISIADKVKDIRLKLIKFRHYGVKGRLGNMQSPDDAYMEQLAQLARELGFCNVKIV